MKLTIRKFDGDDQYSWAVFKSQDVKGTKGIICYGQANPLISGCSKHEAEHYKRKFETDIKS